jgi:molecular chaperone DnaK
VPQTADEGDRLGCVAVRFTVGIYTSLAVIPELMTAHSIGIDLGTTRSVVAYVPDADPEIIKTDGTPVTRSVVHLPEEGEAVVGTDADDHLIIDPDRTVAEVKKLMGEDTEVRLGEETYLPEQISALILDHLATGAQDRIGETVDDVVLTVPAYFGDRERTATRTAGEIAGLDVARLLPEPSAACLAYGLREGKLGESTEELVFVYDLGGGTFDATLVDVDYEANVVETLHTDGDNDLGGGDWTDRVVDWVAKQVQTDTGTDIRAEPEQLARARSEARAAKHSLSRQEAVDVTIPFVVPDENYSFEETLDRETFDERTADLLEATREPMEALFERSDYTPEDVDKTLLVGGSTRMPQVETLLTDYFGSEPSKEVNPDEAVALGAAVQAEIIDDDGTNAEQLLPGDSSGLLLIDVVPKPLGVKLHSGEIDHVIDDDAQIPVIQRKESYGTVHENQDNVKIAVYEGAGDHVDDEGVEKIGEAVLEGIPPRDPGEETLACEFEITADGTLRVQGEDLISGKEVETRIESAVRHSEGEVDELRANLPPVA